MAEPFRWRDMQRACSAEEAAKRDLPLARVKAQETEAEAQAEVAARVEAVVAVVAVAEAVAEADARMGWRAMVWAVAKRAEWRAMVLAEVLVLAFVPESPPLIKARGTQLEEIKLQLQEIKARRMQLRALEQTLGRAPEPITYNEVLADWKLKAIIDSIEPDHRHTLARHLHLSHNRQEYWWLIQIIAPITRLPPELLQQILLIIIDEASDSPFVLMLVCKYWYTTVTGIWASLNLSTRTPEDAVTSQLDRNQWLLDIWVDTEIDRGHFTPSEGAYQGIFAAIQASSRWRSFVVESFPPQSDLPGHLVNLGLQRWSHAVMSRLRTFKIKSACEMSPLLNRLLRILVTTANGELTTIEINSANVISFLVPTHSPIFRSVTVLSLDTPGLRDPVDLLPHLHQLESFTASHLPLPVYHDDANLLFVHTLRHLTLRAVSIQWMSGKTFHVLENCTLLFPLHHHVLHTFHTTLPNCKHLTFEGYPLDILDGVSAHNLTHLSVMCSCSYKPRGNQQLVWFSSQTLRESRLATRTLHISVEATDQAWIKALAFMSNLEELVIHNAQPSSLGVKVLRAFVVQPVQTNNLGTISTPGGRNTPICPSLKRFGLRYRRWLRPSEHIDLIPEFMSIIWSRRLSNFSWQSFRIWTSSNQKNPLELIEGSGISFEGLSRLVATNTTSMAIPSPATMTTTAVHTLAKLPATEILKIVGSNPVAITLVTRSTDEYIDSIQGKSTAQQKQDLGGVLSKVIKAFGVQRALEMSILLLDTEDLRAVAHLMTSYPAVLKEKVLMQAAAAQ